MTRRIFALRMWILPDVSVRNLDYTTKGGFYVSQISGDTDENRSTAYFTVSLSSAPDSGTTDDHDGDVTDHAFDLQRHDRERSQSSDNASLVVHHVELELGADGDGDGCGGQSLRRGPGLRDCADRRQ